MAFVIGAKEIRRRNKNVLLGALLSLILAGLVAVQNLRYPETYNDVLLWSVIAFVILANLVNYYRHRRYARLIRNHRVEVHPGKVRFHTGNEQSELNVNEIAAMFYYRKKGVVQHIQLRLKSNRGIRLEGYDDLDELGRLIADQIPPQHVRDKRL